MIIADVVFAHLLALTRRNHKFSDIATSAEKQSTMVTNTTKLATTNTANHVFKAVIEPQR